MEGAKITNTKILFNKRKAGYTLIEMVVVMAIIAAIIAMGAGGFLSLRNSSQVDAVAEELVSTIRTAQNNSITVKEATDCPTNHTLKGWYVELVHTSSNPDDFNLGYFCGGANNIDSGIKVADPYLSPYKGVTIGVEAGGAPLSADPGHIYFSTPFGKGYVSNAPAPSFTLDQSDASKAWMPVDDISIIPKGFQKLVFGNHKFKLE